MKRLQLLLKKRGVNSGNTGKRPDCPEGNTFVSYQSTNRINPPLGHRRQLKVTEKGITGMISKGKRILMLNLS